MVLPWAAGFVAYQLTAPTILARWPGWESLWRDAQDLLIEVRGQLVNVSLGGTRVLAWRSPLPRRAGTMALITYDAQAEFSQFDLRPLPESQVLLEPQPVTASAKSR